MSAYRVVWEIDVEDVETPLSAACEARDTMNTQIDAVFVVTDLQTGEDTVIDLDR